MKARWSVVGTLVRPLVGCALAAGVIVATAAPASAQPPAHAGDRLTCQPGQQVEIAIKWIGERLTVEFGHVGGSLFEERIFEGGIVREFSVVRTKFTAAQWDGYASGDNGFDINPEGPHIERVEQLCVNL